MPFSALCDDFPGCPADTFKTEVVSPIDSSTKVLCSKKTSTGYVKHGPEWIYDHKGTVLIKKTYNNGELNSTTNQNDKKNNEKPIAEENTSLKKDYSFVKTILHEILHLWHPLRRTTRGQLAIGGFETRSCYVNNYTLERFYQDKIKNFELELNFSKKCSVRGRQMLIWDRPQKVAFKLRDMRDFKELEMQLTLDKSFKKSNGTLLYQVETKMNQAVLRTESGSLKFEASYTLTLDLNKKKILKDHGGKLTIIEFNASEIQKVYPLRIKALELP